MFRAKGLIIIFVMVFVALLSATVLYGQQKSLNIVGIHQLVSVSRAENGRQQSARDKQAVNTLTEEANKTMLFKLKDTYRLLQRRFSFLGMALSAAEVGMGAAPLIAQVSHDQVLLMKAAGADPFLLALVYQSETDFLIRAKNLSAFMIGLSMSIGPLNQMKLADRKMLFDHILNELRVIAALSSGLVGLLENNRRATLLKGIYPLSGYLNTDMLVVEDILRKAKELGL